ncbi:MAG TPA: HAMP domain-containing sensor histidine kinase [Burkholderiales bacterium]|nr:HAMP domain-containing sensor histidine kinase [Burkholderiales bacterium]
MRRLYLQIYLAFVAGIILFTGLMWTAWWLLPDEGRESPTLTALAQLVVDRIPADAPPQRVQEGVATLGRLFRTDVTLRAPDGALIAKVGAELPPPPPGTPGSRLLRGPRVEPRAAIQLADGRWLIVRLPARQMLHFWSTTLATLAVALAIAAFPLARRLTRRLERLQSRVEALGAGDLSVRVEVEGRDEIAELARSFNRTAERIERLVDAERTMLTSASHELRSPLARMRVAIELLQREDRPDLREKLARDIAELDDLIGEMLLATRLQGLGQPERLEEVDLLALLAEEGARAGAEVGGEPARVHGDDWMLRRLVRNLFDNAQRYGGGSAIEASVHVRNAHAVLEFADRGPGIPEAERERIFEPFYRMPGTRERGDGVGLGLSLVRRIARYHGGEARCLVRAGGGTIFEVSLPV